MLSSPAKVNLSLRIVGKRTDGYHELETVFQEVDWADEIDFRESSDFSLKISGADLPHGNSNLIVKAAHALARKANLPCCGQLHLTKELPLQGGVGGGSSNAAITLIGLNRLWDLKWPGSRLEPIARELGADCPFFLHGGLARATGRGDVIEPLNGASEGHFVLVSPPFGVETAWAFTHLTLPLTEVEKNAIFSPLWLTEEGSPCPREFLRNDLENIVFQRYSALRELRDRLLDLGAAGALLSGSGSTLYGIFDSEPTALRAAQVLSGNETFRVKVCRAVARER